MSSKDMDYKESKVFAEPKRLAAIKEIAVGFVFSAIAYVLGYADLWFGASPFGMAFLCASDRKIPYIYCGLCVSALLSGQGFIYIAAYTVALLVRVLIRLTIDPPWKKGEASAEISLSEILPKLFSENIFLRMSTACVGIFAVGLYTMIKGGFLYYDLFGAVLSMILAPLGVFSLFGLFGAKEGKGIYSFVSLAALGFGTVLSSNELYIYGISLSALIAIVMTLAVCEKKGIIFGMITGAVCGLAYSPLLAPSFFLAALTAGVLWKVSVFFACLSAFGAGAFWALYIDGISSVLTVLPALFVGCVLFAVARKTLVEDRKQVLRNVKEKADIKALDRSETVDAELKTKDRECGIASVALAYEGFEASLSRRRKLCNTFEAMSEFFDELGEKMKQPVIYDTKNICDSAFDACCGTCRCNSICWEERHTDTMAAVTSLCATLHREGKISAEAAPESLRAVCERLPDIIDEINHNFFVHSKQLLLCDKTEIFALDYKAVSELLAAGIQLDEDEFAIDMSLSSRLCSAIEGSVADVESAAVCGRAQKKAVIITCHSFDENETAQLAKLVESALGVHMVLRSRRIEEGKRERLVYASEGKIRVEHAESSLSSAFEDEFCGDSVAVFENGAGNLFALISDGMGSGREAALTSGISAMFLKKMLSATASSESALRLLNGFLRNKGGGSIHECSATVDLLEIDPISSKAVFYKSGAAPSYVYRDGNLFKLRSNTVPLGIIKELDAKRITFDLQKGDIIVMVSDGVTGGREECPWLFELLKKKVPALTLSSCAELIIDRARRENSSDDISVLLLKINGVGETERSA